MPSIENRLFLASSVLRVRDVTLSAGDDPQVLREKLARVVLDEMYQFVGLLDPSGLVLEISRAALEGAGIRLEDVQGKPFWEARWWAVSKEAQECAKESIRRASKGEFVRCDVENYGQSAGEETIVVDFSLLPVKDQNGKVVFLLAEGRNITEKKLAEAEIASKNQELQRLLERIQKLDEAKSDFFANVSHELRTPLALILGPAESILDDGANLTDLQRRDLNVIHRNAATLMKHVNDLLDLAKYDAGQLAMSYIQVDLAQRVRTVFGNFDALASQRSISYVLGSPEKLMADVDPEKFDRILINLLSNAFKFTPYGGQIKCSLERSGHNQVLLSVQDSGPGIRADMRAVIFERFRQAQGGSTRDFGGTGLGLAIAKDFVVLHGGTITVLDAPGGGAKFSVELPLCAPKAALVQRAEFKAKSEERAVAVESAVEELLRSEEGLTNADQLTDRPLILVVEDNSEMRRFITEVLSGEYRVVQAADGEEALKKAVAEPPDLVVTDLMMPKLGGDRLVEELRKLPNLAQIPVLVLSAKEDEALRLKLLSESIQDYITKPFSPNELRVRIRNLVTVKTSRDLLQKELTSQTRDLSELTQEIIGNRQALQQSYDALQEAEQRWRAVYENLAAGIVLTDLDGKVMSANPALQKLLGYSESDLKNMAGLEFSDEASDESIRTKISNFVSQEIGGFWVQKYCRRSDGSFIWVNASVAIISATKISQKMFVGIIEDITERKRAEEKVRYLAYFDALTGLPNRVRFEELLRETVARGREKSHPVALLILALERFRDITYTLGQANGNLLLQQIAPRLRSVLHVNDTIAHFGGKHFAVMISGAGVHAASETAVEILKGFEQPFEIAGLALEIGANIGISVFPGHGDEADKLIRRAEVALHWAQHSTAAYGVYAEDHDSYKPRRLQLLGELRSAIGDQQLALFCQPKLDLKTHEIVALEALVRWQHPTYGVIGPDQFVPFIETTGLIGPLTRWVIDATIAQCHTWQQCGIRVPVAVNLSARDLSDPKLIDYIQNELLTWGADPSWLDLEITESSIMAEPELALDTLSRLSRLGFKLFVDDFGTGYSSLEYLQRLPVKAIKIDKSFVLPVLEDSAAEVIVRSTLDLGHNLGLEVVAEGVESKDVCEHLTKMGCDEAQGYYLSPPIPVSEFSDWLQTSRWPLRKI
ncbi:Sensor histidine kinase RcsC [compost metagenome]